VRFSEFYEKMVHNYLTLGDEENMFACLEKAVEHAIKFDTPIDGIMKDDAGLRPMKHAFGTRRSSSALRRLCLKLNLGANIESLKSRL